MDFRFTAVIERPLADVFAFFRDVDQHAGKEGTRVPVYDKVTPGPAGVGTRYREVVQVLPFVRGEMLSEIIEYEEGKRLGYQFEGMAMEGELAYTFEAVEGGTRVVQEQALRPRGMLRRFGAAIGKTFSTMAQKRLDGITALLEQGVREGVG